MADPTSAAISKQAEYVTTQPQDAVGKQAEYVTTQPQDAVGKQVEYIAKAPIQAVSKQVEYIVIGPLPPESLTITSASDANGTLSIGGAINYADLTALDISTDGGTTFSPASNLSVTGTTYAAKLVQYLTAGSYEIVSEDVTTSVQSDPFPLTIAEALTLANAGFNPSSGGVLTLQGFCNSISLTDLNISVDGETPVAGTLTGFSNGIYTVKLDGSISIGTHTAYTEDPATSLQSNVKTFVIAAPSVSTGSLPTMLLM
jgi:hypothetical protein